MGASQIRFRSVRGPMSREEVRRLAMDPGYVGVMDRGWGGGPV
jgi:hypothetical protein